MEKFSTLTAVAAPLPMINVDTDMIIPKQFLKTTARRGLARGLFFDWRSDADFVLNQPRYQGASILVAGENFGCGSSREHAPWALLDFGIRCVIAPSFGDIFYNNCCKNGLLPIRLARPPFEVSELAVDLEGQTVGGTQFEIDPYRKQCLLLGLDDIALTLQHEADITAYEATLGD